MFVPRGQLPPALASGFGDHVTGMTLAGGIAGALFDRERTGRGHLVATSLLRCGAYGGAWSLGTLLRFGKLSGARAREATPTPQVNCYQAGDGHAFWLLGLEADRHWPGLVAAIERDDLLVDERFVNAAARARHAEALVAELDIAFASHTLDVLTARFDEHDVWWAPINTAFTIRDDPQVEASGAFIDMTPRDGEGPYRAVATPIDFDGMTIRPGPVPTLGEHTTEVLAALDA
jgi:crotonobetainyl-CoA:carnitine CoA-transferase CaiB-like acyl-CoA transferase